jgi:histone-lysine N-methyltransferase SETD1
MNATSSSRAAPSSAPHHVTDTITPVNTPPETRISVFPTDGVLAKRLVYDPYPDTKLDKKVRHSKPAQYKTVVEKVREGYT